MGGRSELALAVYGPGKDTNTVVYNIQNRALPGTGSALKTHPSG